MPRLQLGDWTLGVGFCPLECQLPFEAIEYRFDEPFSGSMDKKHPTPQPLR